MTDTTPAKKPAPPDITQQFAIPYLAKGWRAIPLKTREKNPGRKEWQHEIHSPTTVGDPDIWGLPCNVGVVLGDVSGGLVDVDLDCAEAIALAPVFLPTTPAIFGRPGKVDSHWLYVCRGIRYLKCEDVKDKDGKTATLCELRGNNANGVAGFQTVFPPSLHRDTGERIMWKRRQQKGLPEPTEVTAAVLQLAYRKLAVATILVRHWPGEGSRHKAAGALGGLLARTGWPEDECLDFARVVFDAAGCESIDTHVQYVQDSLTKGPTERLAGGPTLAKLLDGDGTKILENIHEWWRLPADGLAKPAINVEDIYDSGIPVPFGRDAANIDFPVDVFPTKLRDYARAISEAMQVNLDFVCVALVGFLGAVLQRRLTINVAPDWREVAVLWTAIVAPPGEKKSPVFHELSRPLRAYDARVWEQYEQARDTLDTQIESEESLGRSRDMSRLRNLKQSRKDLQKPQFLLAQDVTIEMVIRDLKDNPSFCFVSPDSNLLQNFCGRYGNKGDDLAHILNGYDGANITYKRVGQGPNPVYVHVADGRLGFLMAFQHPGLDAMNDFLLRNKGASDRICFYVLPRQTVPKKHPKHLTPIPLELRQWYDVLVQDLLVAPEVAAVPVPTTVPTVFDDDLSADEVSTEVLASTPGLPPRIHLNPPEYLGILMSDSDKTWFEEVFDAAELQKLDGAMFQAITGWTSKWPGKVARIVGILEVVRAHANEPPPSADDLILLAAFYLAHADNALNQADVAGSKTQTTNDECLALLDRIQKLAKETSKSSFSGREIFRAYQKIGNMGRLDQLIDILEYRGYVQIAAYNKTTGRLNSATRIITLSPAPVETTGATTNGASHA